MKRYLCSNDFEVPHQLEAEISALAAGGLTGSALCFVRDRDTYSPTVVTDPEFQRSRVTPPPLAPVVEAVVDHVDNLGDGPIVSETVFFQVTS